MKFNCSFCHKYWELMNTAYFNKLKHSKEEAAKDVVLFCPVCRVSQVRKDRWDKKYDKKDT